MPRMQSLKGSLNKDGPEERNDLLKFDVRRNMTQNLPASSKKGRGSTHEIPWEHQWLQSQGMIRNPQRPPDRQGRDHQVHGKHHGQQ